MKNILTKIFSGFGFYIILALFLLPLAQARTLYVGPDFNLKIPSEAIKIAKDGDVIKIAAGLYENDTAIIQQNNLTVEAIGGYAHLKSSTKIPNGKAIWVTRGQNITLRHIEFSGARVPDKNGAGIRLERGSLLIENCYFHDNEMGLISSNYDDIQLHIIQSEFNHNIQNYPVTGKLSHNIYIGSIAEFTLENSLSRAAQYGHALKSRARKTTLKNNRIMDEGDISASYLIDIPNGGIANIENNSFFRNAGAQNNAIISYGAEGMSYKENFLSIRHNSGSNDKGIMFLLKNHSSLQAIFTGNQIKNITAREIPGIAKDGFWDRMKDKIGKYLH